MGCGRLDFVGINLLTLHSCYSHGWPTGSLFTLSCCKYRQLLANNERGLETRELFIKAENCG